MVANNIWRDRVSIARPEFSYFHPDTHIAQAKGFKNPSGPNFGKCVCRLQLQRGWGAPGIRVSIDIWGGYIVADLGSLTCAGVHFHRITRATVGVSSSIPVCVIGSDRYFTGYSLLQQLPVPLRMRSQIR